MYSLLRAAVMASFGCVLVFAVGGCKQSLGSRVADTAPGGQENDITGNGSIGNEVGSSMGDANGSINSVDYFKPNGTPFTWTDDMTQTVMAGLATSCPDPSGSSQGTNTTGMVAFTLNGSCQLITLAEAQRDVADLGVMYAMQGTSLVDVMNTDAAAEQLQTADAAIPAIDLGALVAQEQANNSAVSSGSNTSLNLTNSLALDDPPTGDGWTGTAKSYTVGSNQFSATASGYFYVLNKNGVGLRSSADITGQAFSVQRSLAYAKLQAQALSSAGNPATVNFQVQAFGQDLYNQTYTEPQYKLTKNLYSLHNTFGGSLSFAVGPVPFSISWSFLVTGDVPVTVTLSPTAVSGGINPNAGATVGLEGGADIKIAKAGVDGSLTIIQAGFNGSSTVALATNSAGQPAVCYTAKFDFALNNMLGGKLSAFAQVGRPDVRIFNIPMGWRGNLTFVDWTGTSYDLPILAADQECIAIIQ